MDDQLIAVTLMLPRSVYVQLRESAFERRSTVTAELTHDAIRKAQRMRRGGNAELLALHMRKLTVPEIAAQLGWTNSRVKTQLHRHDLTPNRPQKTPKYQPRKRT